LARHGGGHLWSQEFGSPAGQWLHPAGSRAVAGGLLRSRAPGGGVEPSRPLIHFVNSDGETLTTKEKVGDSLLDVVVKYNLDIDGFGTCEGTLACSTCHLIFEDHIFMLDLEYGLTDRSRLRCQICLTKSVDNMTVQVPETVADARQSIDVGKTS
uniref:Adrenal ferredoxin n=1 Tax=Saimiri boliviensis boliviensis TaxID=39432 RepID=A0A2K6RZ07_SAIBB